MVRAMKKARVLSIVFVVVLLAVAIFAEAQQPKKVARIGYLLSFDPATESTRSEAIRLALRELGYIEGQNIAIEYRYSERKVDRAPELAAELVRRKVNIIIVAVGAGPIRAFCSLPSRSSKADFAGLIPDTSLPEDVLTVD
jgi:ABC-type uncharacterized transport system substrate-binding protein